MPIVKLRGLFVASLFVASAPTRRMRKRRCLLAAAIIATGMVPAGAADIRLDPSREGAAGAVLEGRIETGDFEKFRTFIFKENTVELYLASPGGNLAEAMKIGALVRSLRLSTMVPGKTLTNQKRNLAIARRGLKDPRANYMCSSACFLVFVAGIHRSSDDFGPPILGIHRPFVPGTDVKTMSANNPTAVEDRTQQLVDNYLRAMDVPAKYAESMFSVPKKKILWIRNDEFKTDLDGFIPRLKAWVKAKCDLLIGKNEPQVSCERQVQDELALRAYGDLLQKRSQP